MANTGLSTFMHAKRDEKTGEYAAPGKMAGAIDSRRHWIVMMQSCMQTMS